MIKWPTFHKLKLIVSALILAATSMSLNLSFAVAQGLAGTRWQSILDQLEQTGIRRIGDLNLTQLRSAGNRMHWGEVSGRPESIYSGDRGSGYYSNGQPHLSNNLPQAAMGSIAQQELHEIFGALRYRDGSGGLSGTLVMLSEMPDSAERRKLVSFYAKTLFKNSIMKIADGGATGVSGGGDLGITATKEAVRKLIMSEGRVPQNSFMHIFPRINFEPAQVSRVQLRYKFTYNAKGKPDQEFFTVIVPANAANRVDESTVAEIAQKLTQIFPASASAESVPFHPSECPAGKTINFPPTNDPDVRYIQNNRGAALLNCAWHIQGMQAREVTTSAESGTREMRQPMVAVYSCTLNLNGMNIDNPTHKSAVTGNANWRNFISSQAGVSGGTIMPNLIVDGTGRILGTRIAFHPEKGQLIIGDFYPAQSATSARGQFQTSAGLIDFSCQYSPYGGN